MNPPTQPPQPSHRAPRRRIARELTGLLLACVGAAGLLGVILAEDRQLFALLTGILSATFGAAVLYRNPPLSRLMRMLCGYGSLTLGLAKLVAVFFAVTPWTLLFGVLLAVAVWLSGGEE